MRRTPIRRDTRRRAVETSSREDLSTFNASSKTAEVKTRLLQMQSYLKSKEDETKEYWLQMKRKEDKKISLNKEVSEARKQQSVFGSSNEIIVPRKSN